MKINHHNFGCLNPLPLQQPPPTTPTPVNHPQPPQPPPHPHQNSPLAPTHPLCYNKTIALISPIAMTKNLPTVTPAEVVEISPEALEVANCYLTNPSVEEVSSQLALPPEMVTDILARREVKAYINQVFFDTGFNNRFRMRAAMDALIQRKFQELDEAGVGSSKDIAELLALSHKMTLELMEKEIALEKIKQNNIKSQVNVQINENGLGGGTNYGNLIERLIRSDV